MRRIGVIGGTFDPVHHGHLLLARFALEQILLDEVLFIPAADPPLKQGAYAPAEERWAMVELAVAGCADFAASRLELDRPGKSYTVETLRLLHQRRRLRHLHRPLLHRLPLPHRRQRQLPQPRPHQRVAVDNLRWQCAPWVTLRACLARHPAARVTLFPVLSD